MHFQFSERISSATKLEKLMRDLNALEPMSSITCDADEATITFVAEIIDSMPWKDSFRRITRNIKKIFPKARIIQSVK